MAAAATPCRRSLFRPVKNNVTGELDRALNPNSVYRNIVQKYEWLDSRDQPVLLAAIHGNAAYLLTDDAQHFRHLYGE
jgi:hypothetical protein